MGAEHDVRYARARRRYVCTADHGPPSNHGAPPQDKSKPRVKRAPTRAGLEFRTIYGRYANTQAGALRRTEDTALTSLRARVAATPR